MPSPKLAVPQSVRWVGPGIMGGGTVARCGRGRHRGLVRPPHRSCCRGGRVGTSR